LDFQRDGVATTVERKAVDEDGEIVLSNVVEGKCECEMMVWMMRWSPNGGNTGGYL
jgi:hypothetical protein